MPARQIISITTPAPYMQVHTTTPRTTRSSRSSIGSNGVSEGNWRPFPTTADPNNHDIQGSTHTMRTIPRPHSRTESESTIKVHEEDEESKYGTVASWHTAHQGSEVNGNVKDVFRDQDGEEEDDLEWAAVTDEEDHLVCYIVCHV